tara:strand:+ start:34 stop:999 length:966 start_codon:yes stop_codon:yes gene_type:complete
MAEKVNPTDNPDLFELDFDDPAAGNWGLEGGESRGGPAFTPASDQAVEPKFNLFSTPSMLSMAKFGVGALTSYFGHQTKKYETQRQNAEAERQYWEQWRNQSEQNYRAYDYQLKSFYRESDYVQKKRQYEQQLKQQQAVYKGETAIAATENLGRQIADLDAQFYEAEAKEAIEIEVSALEADKKASKRVASGQVGRSVDAVRGQYYQQYLGVLEDKTITKKFRVANKILAGEAEAIAANNAVKDIRDYTPQPIADPIKPVAPLPVRGIKPAKAAGPSSSALAIDIATQGFQAYERYQAMQPNIARDNSTTNNDPSPTEEVT